VTARSTLVLAGAFLLCGAAFDSPSLYVPAIALALLATGARLWVGLAARAVRVEHEPGPWSIVEGDPYRFGVVIHAGRLPLPGARAVHPLAKRSPRVGIRGSGRITMEAASLRRGRRRLAPAAVRISDPLGLHTTEIASPRGDQVLVLPRVAPVTWSAEGGAGTAGGEGHGIEGLGHALLDTRAIEFELDGLRPYRQGSPASRIHWPTVARVGEVLEHRLVASVGSSPLVVLDSSAPADEEALDRAVRAAASLCVHLARSGGCALLLPGERRALEIDSQLRTWPRAHASLAVVAAGGPRPAIGRVRMAGEIFWVTPAAVVPGGTRGLGPGTYVVTPFPLPGLRPAFSVAGCHGHRLDLAKRRRGIAATRAA